VVEIVAIERDERPCELPSQAEVLDVARAAQIVVLQHEEHVPLQPLTHEADDAVRDVRVGIDARLPGGCVNDRPKLGRQRTHCANDVCPVRPARPPAPWSTWPPWLASAGRPRGNCACGPIPCARGGCTPSRRRTRRRGGTRSSSRSTRRPCRAERPDSPCPS